MQPASSISSQRFASLLDEVVELREQVTVAAERRLEPYRVRYPEGFTSDARNLASYLALRANDLRPLQERLVEAGVSSLGRGEAQVTTNLNRVIGVLGTALGIPEPIEVPEEGQPRLERRTDALFGRRANDRYARIMVTLPTEAASEPALVDALVASGMDCVRINCAHDGPEVWRAMIDNVRAAERSRGARIRVFMDLAGHKIRTGPVQTAVAVVSLKVPRDRFGRRKGVARVLLTDRLPETPLPEAYAGLPCLPLSAAVVAGKAGAKRRQSRDPHAAGAAGVLGDFKAGDRLVFKDARDKWRTLQLRERLPSGPWLAESSRSAYVVPGAALTLKRKDGHADAAAHTYTIADFPGKPVSVRLFRGDPLLLMRDARPGRAAEGDVAAAIGCSHPQVIDQLRPEHAVWIDDGKLGCRVERIDDDGAWLRVTHAGPKGVRIREDKGINLPDTSLPLPALTDKDLTDLEFVCANADMVGLSFVRTLDDVDELRRQLAARGRSDLPIVVKIETGAAVRNLPDILLGTLGLHAIGIMIARGDLAVELGSVRMAEIQEEILWICEAARAPVIWATQVLETLAKDGVINRPEITDAAMSVRAECVMMNKGPFITDAVVILNDILTRMDAHQYKKVSRLRRLHW